MRTRYAVTSHAKTPLVLLFTLAECFIGCTPVGSVPKPVDGVAGDGVLVAGAGDVAFGMMTNANGVAGDAATGGIGISAGVGAAMNGGVAGNAAIGGGNASNGSGLPPSNGVAGGDAAPPAAGMAGTPATPGMPCVPSTEICDGIDNDCDGMTDEQVAKKCWADLDGDGVAAAAAAVMESCDECGALQTAREPATPDTTDCDDNDKTKSPQATDVCGDGIDNDCNGSPDDKSNNACDGPCTMQLPGKPGEACSNGLKGACARAGRWECQPDHTIKCSAEAVTGSAEKCGDSSDNDCDGTVDNGCVMNKCGGWTKLSPDKGTSCSMGDGTCKATGSYECDGPDRTVCMVLPKTPNGCGGCTSLSNLGDRCTAKCSSDGTYICDGRDATKCSVTAKPTNGCGGCSSLAHERGTSCSGECGARGSYTCVSGSTDQTTCTLTSTPQRNLCGGCGANPSGASDGQRCSAGMNSCATIGTWQCTGAGDSAKLACSATAQAPSNGCGGCIGPNRGASCVATDSSGTQVDGVYVCDGELTYCEPRTAP